MIPQIKSFVNIFYYNKFFDPCHCEILDRGNLLGVLDPSRMIILRS
ncbi:MAG: hypothetical protein ACLRFL_00655 [Clostridia bacterium]